MKRGAALLALLTAASCQPIRDNVVKPIDAAFDCNTICTRYQSCFDHDYDVAKCADDCRASAQRDPEYYRAVNACEACISDRACASATFSCGVECGRVVP